MSVTALNVQPKVPTVEIVELTPALAEEWLGLNTNNRPRKGPKSAMYAHDIAEGNWMLTGEAVKFDWNGRLIDGQNRCFAVIDANMSITTIVVRGLDPEVQAVLDSGSPRTARDSLNMKGYERSGDLAATVLAYSLLEKGVYKTCMTQTPGYARPTNYQVVKYVHAHPSLVDSVKMAKPVQRRLPLAIGAITTAYDVLSKIDADDAHEFFERIRDKRTNGKGDPVLTLLDKANDMRDNRERRWPSTCLYLIFTAWNAYRKGKTLNSFRLGNDKSGWSAIPQPK